ncbi:putative glycoside hydrolase [Thermosulfuriphilus sp.]
MAASLYSQFGFPETSDGRIAILVDQLPTHMTKEQISFAAKHYVGSQKLTLPISQRLRRHNPHFVVLHYHLGIWQQQPAHRFIIDGQRWGNDWDYVTRHEDWFWHNEKGERVRSRIDGKYLMNIAHPGFQDYWKKSIFRQMLKGRYQGVFLDSSSVALLEWEASHADPRLAGAAAVKRRFRELGGLTWSEAYEMFMARLTAFLEALGYVTLPNIGGLFTTWDTTDYYTTASGAFMEGAFVTKSQRDWEMSARRLLRLIKNDKIVIFQSYLRKGDADLKTRLYYLACYLLFKGRYTYLNYFSQTPLSWYPEWSLDLGSPTEGPLSLEEMRVKRGLFRRRYAKGEVWVNIGPYSRRISFDTEVRKVVPLGGGPVPKSGQRPGKLLFESISQVTIAPWSGLIVFYQ